MLSPVKLLPTFTLIAAIVLSILPSSAAEPDNAPPRRPDQPPQQPGPFQRGMRPGGMAQRGGGLPFEAVLDADQRMQFREEMEGQRERLRELDEKSMKLRRELDDALLDEKLDEKIVREKSAALGELETERSLMRARAFAKIRPSLTKEQLERLQNMRADFTRGPAGEFRPADQGVRRPSDRFEPPRGPRPPGEPGGDDVLPPPAPRPPQGPPPPGQDRR